MGNKRGEEEDKNNKNMHPSLFGHFPLCYIKSLLPSPEAPPSSPSAPPSPPCHWSARPPPHSHKLPGSEPIQGERGSQHQPPGTKEVGDDPQSLGWTLAGLTLSSALIVSASRSRPGTSWAPHPPTSTTNACRVSSSSNLLISRRARSRISTLRVWGLAKNLSHCFRCGAARGREN